MLTALEGAAVSNTSAPTIAGTAQVGQSLTASPGEWTPSGVALAYEWLANGTPIAGATLAAYTPTTADIGKTIQVRVTGTKSGYASGDAVSAPTAAVTPAPAPPTPTPPTPTPPTPTPQVTNTAAPVISGKAAVGGHVMASTGAWTPAVVTVGYQWLLDGVAVSGATGSTYDPVPGDAGKKLAVRALAAAPGYTSATAVSAPVTVAFGSITNTARPKIKGSIEVGGTVKATSGTWAPATVTLTYQWFADGKKIKGADAKTLKIVKGLLGDRLTVRVTAKAKGYEPEHVMSKKSIEVEKREAARRQTAGARSSLPR